MADNEVLHQVGGSGGPIVRVVETRATTHGSVCKCVVVTSGVWAWARWEAGTLLMPWPSARAVKEVTCETA